MYPRLLRHFLLAGIGITLTLMPVYSATISQYSDATVFGQLTQGMTIITFDDQVSINSYTTANSSGFTISHVQFLGLTDPPGYDTAIYWYPGSIYYDWGTNAVLKGPGGSTQKLHIALPGTGNTALGMNLATTYPAGGSYTITLSTGDIITSVPTAATKPITFWGVTSDTPITWIDLSSSQGSIILDNFQFGSAVAQQPDQPVAESATLILIGTGLLGLPFLRRMKLMFPV